MNFENPSAPAATSTYNIYFKSCLLITSCREVTESYIVSVKSFVPFSLGHLAFLMIHFGSLCTLIAVTHCLGVPIYIILKRKFYFKAQGIDHGSTNCILVLYVGCNKAAEEANTHAPIVKPGYFGGMRELLDWRIPRALEEMVTCSDTTNHCPLNAAHHTHTVSTSKKYRKTLCTWKC